LRYNGPVTAADCIENFVRERRFEGPGRRNHLPRARAG
jgi:hypothetical protein